MPTPGVLDPTDLRYERYFPLVPSGTPRTADVWQWQQHRVHVEHIGEPDAPVRVLLVHGAGGNASSLWPFAAQLACLGARVTLPDLPGYGRTWSRHPSRLRQHHWGDLLADLVAREADERPLIVTGASIGGMLALDTATRTGMADAVVATALLDMSDPAVRAAAFRTSWLAGIGQRALPVVAGPLAGLRLPLRWVSRMHRITNDPDLLAELLGDHRGAGGSATLGWMRSLITARPHTPAEQVDVPVLLVHGDDDRWTPMPLSVAYLRRIPAPTAVVPLVGSGHFPADDAGLATAMNSFARVLDALATCAPEERRAAVTRALGALDTADVPSPEGAPALYEARMRFVQQTIVAPSKPKHRRPRHPRAPMVTMVVTGRRSGEAISLPLAMLRLDGRRYLVAMGGESAHWVHNVRAADGAAVLRHRRTLQVRLVELGADSDQRSAVLHAYLAAAPAAERHLGVSASADPDDIAALAAELPIFRVDNAGRTPRVRPAARRQD